jgi:hypothetical protein
MAAGVQLGEKAVSMLVRFIIVALLSAPLAGCITATFGEKPHPVAEKKNIFNFKVYVNAYSMLSPETADKRAQKELEAFRVERGYSSFKIVSRRFNGVPLTYYEYEAEFHE